MIAAIEAKHPHLTTQKDFCVGISRVRERARLVTDDAAGLRAQLQAATGERIAALEGIGEMARGGPERASEAGGSPAKASAKAMGNAVAGGRSGTDLQTAQPAHRAAGTEAAPVIPKTDRQTLWLARAGRAVQPAARHVASAAASTCLRKSRTRALQRME